MGHKSLIVGLGVAMLCVVVQSAAGPIYRWVDDNGVVQYSDTPPTDQKAGTVTVPSQDAAPAPAAPPTPAPTPAKAPAGAADDDTPTLSDAQQAEVARIRAENCKRARSNLAYLQSNPPNRLLNTDDTGTVYRMTEEEHSERMRTARRVIGENCTPQ